MWRSFVTSSISRGSIECLWKHSTNLFLFYHRHYRETTCTPTCQPHLTYYYCWHWHPLPGGGELSDIRHVFGVSVAEAYNCIECFIESTLHCDSMRITLPRHPEEWDAMSSGFAKVSRDELFGG